MKSATRKGSITLEADTLYDIVVEYFENTGGAVARLFWSSPSQSQQIIPIGVKRDVVGVL